MTAPTPNSETIERELAALGEAPPSAEELALLESGGLHRLDHLDHAAEIAGVARLAELAEPLAFEDLSELETHRGWRTVEQRLTRPGSAADVDPGDARPSDSSPSGGGPRRWLFAALGLAAAAAIVLIIVRPSASEPLDPEQVAELGEQARASLQILEDGASDTQRAEQLAAEYQQRLEEQGG
ncbi:MAG TPA: hypothetical protein VK034_03510 [Enhygromyxa sp.]|nr:hypothetical protein [Enhygromyxa sp.]